MSRISRTRDNNKEKLLDTAERLMLQQGYPTTTLDAVCQASGLTKGGLFYYFKNKEELGRAVLDRFVTHMWDRARASGFMELENPLARINGYLDFIVGLTREASESRACLLGHFSQELADTHPELRRCCVGHFNDWIGVLARTLDEAKTRYAPEADFDPCGLAEYFVATLEGALILARANQDNRVIEVSVEHFRSYLNTLYKH